MTTPQNADAVARAADDTPDGPRAHASLSSVGDLRAQVEALREELIASIMARTHAASGVPVFVDPVILRALFDRAAATLLTSTPAQPTIPIPVEDLPDEAKRVLYTNLWRQLEELRERDRVLSHQLERRASGMDPLTQDLRALREAAEEKVHGLQRQLEGVVRSMRDYLDSDDGKMPCSDMDYTGCDPETDRCHLCGWPKHAHDVMAWYLALASPGEEGVDHGHGQCPNCRHAYPAPTDLAASVTCGACGYTHLMPSPPAGSPQGEGVDVGME